MISWRIFWVLGFVLLVGGVGGAAWFVTNGWELPHLNAPAEESLDNATDLDGVVCFGYVDLENGIRMLTPTRSGRVCTVHVRESQEVQTNAPLLSLDDQDVKLQLEEAQKSLDAAQVRYDLAAKLPTQHQAKVAQQEAAVQAAIAKLAAAQQLAAHKQELSKDKLIHAREASIAQDQVREVEALEKVEQEKLVELRSHDPQLAVRAARVELELAQVRVRQAQRQIEECTLRAPAAGTVQRLMIGVGDTLAGQPAVQFCPAAPRIIRADIEQEFAHRIRVGQSALVKDDARSGNKIWRGKVIRMADWFSRRRPQVQEPTQYLDVRTVECLVALDPGQEPMRIGQRVRVLLGEVP